MKALMMWRYLWIIKNAIPALLFLPACSAPPAGEASGRWYEMLPDCPCTAPDAEGMVAGDGWAVDKGDIATYHPGATVCYRSYPYVETPAGKSGQQCCYDQEGKLITRGSGAGTPDMASTCSGEDEQGRMRLRWAGLFGHYRKDVRPWKKAGGWKTYNEGHPPNQGAGCAPNELTVQ